MMHELGVSLIEIVISILLLSILLLGLDALQITSLREAKRVYFFSVAAQQLIQMSERLKTSKGNNLDAELMFWNQQNIDILPQGRGIVNGHYPDYVITLFWGKTTQMNCNQHKMGQEGCLKLDMTI